jgi:signal transduction histidine kinase/ActR/RegA family two-component response regulator
MTQQLRATNEPQNTVLVMAPIGRDTELICDALRRVKICAHGASHDAGLEKDTDYFSRYGAMIIGEEALEHAAARKLIDALEKQPVWSDLPVIILASTHGFVGRNRENAQEIFNSSNVTFLQRPVPTMSLVSSVRAALRARTRQYQVKDLLEYRERQLLERDAFLAMLGHELRNPLAPVRNAIYVWKSNLSTEAQKIKARESMERQVQHMSRLVDDLLDVARISRGKISLRRERCDLCQLLRSSVEDHRGQIEKMEVDLDLRVPQSPVYADGDRTRLAQVIGNLIQNAAKFTDKGGRISVGLRGNCETSSAVITVSDTGIGMSGETLRRIFEPFNQGDASLERNRGGLGLGLAVAKKLVELHEGRIEAASEGVGKGSTFTVTLPAHFEEATMESTEANEAKTGAGKSVLLVEDNADAAETTKLVLELMGHRVVHAYNGRDAIDIAHKLRPDVVLCDIGLPGINGYEVATALRKNNQCCTLIALTGYGQQEDHRRARDAGFDLHLTKPVDPALLESTLMQEGVARAERQAGDGREGLAANANDPKRDAAPILAGVALPRPAIVPKAKSAAESSILKIH